MTKKDFELIANAVRSVLEQAEAFPIEHDGAEGVRVVAREFAFVLGRTNPRFDRERFLTACGVK